jgi:hypothetical protein
VIRRLVRGSRARTLAEEALRDRIPATVLLDVAPRGGGEPLGLGAIGEQRADRAHLLIRRVGNQPSAPMAVETTGTPMAIAS